MSEKYFDLKCKLEDLGYNYNLPLDAVPLVENLLADLLQTTRSLQHYMDISKEALEQRDSLMLKAEPYRCENAKLIQENNRLHRELIGIKEENMKLSKDYTRKIKTLSEELIQKDNLITKLKHDIRDLSLRGLCAATTSSRNKSKIKDENNKVKTCICRDENKWEPEEKSDLQQTLQELHRKNESLSEEIIYLKKQVEHRDHEIIRLNMLLEGGRPFEAVNKECCYKSSNAKIQNLLKQLSEMKLNNDLLKKELERCLQKQHEAMERALFLADKNKMLESEIEKVDNLALKVEEDCNKRVGVLMNDIKFMQSKIENLTMRNKELEKELTNKTSIENSQRSIKLSDFLNAVIKEKELLQKEIQNLIELNKSLQTKIASLLQINNSSSKDEDNIKEKYFITKEEMQNLFQEERKKYEKHIETIEDKFNNVLKLLNNNIKNEEKNKTQHKTTIHDEYFKNLQRKLCENEQRLLILRKENDELKSKIVDNESNSKQNYKDIIAQLNAENTELSKDNIMLSKQLNHYKNLKSVKTDDSDFTRKKIESLEQKIKDLQRELEIKKQDKNEYNLCYKESLNIIDNLKTDIAFKQKQIEILQEENNSYKMSNRTKIESAEHLKEECEFLRKQIKKLQSDFIKEKTLASQIKSVQLETERYNTDVHNELLQVQKKLSLAQDTIKKLEKNNKDLQAELVSLQNDKAKLIENLKEIDKERDNLIIELDNKTEHISVLEQKLSSQSFSITQLENELSSFKRKLNVSKVSEHKLVDYETQIAFLNGEISKLTQQLDNAALENKRLQNNLGEANGTLRITKIDHDKSKKEVESLKQQLQHYVAEIRRIEEMLSHKEAERSDMLEQFASLSVEANILENTNHSLESESASKSLQMQSCINKIQALEAKLLEKDVIIDNQTAQITTMTCKISTLENEIKLITEEKIILEQNISHLKHMCQDLQSDFSNKIIKETDSELKLYENRIKSLSAAKANLESERTQLKSKLETIESLLSNARKEIVELKLALQDATSETKMLQERLNSYRRVESQVQEKILHEEIELPFIFDDTIHEVSHEEDEDSSRYQDDHKKFSKYSRGGTI